MKDHAILLLQLPFKAIYFCKYFYLGHVIIIVYAAVFEIFVYKNGQINTFMSIPDCLLLDLVTSDKQNHTLSNLCPNVRKRKNRTIVFSLLC